MSHYYALVIVPAEGDLNELVAQAMNPYDENEHCTEEHSEDGETWRSNPVGLWDWWQIGGRWTGILDGYQPETDPRNRVTCWLCHGTGQRDDEAGQRWRAENPAYTCNGCRGTGIETKWPTQWTRHNGDVISAGQFVALLADEVFAAKVIPYTVIAHGSESMSTQRRWDGEAFVTEHDDDSIRRVLATVLRARAEAGLDDRVVVVDYHS